MHQEFFEKLDEELEKVEKFYVTQRNDLLRTLQLIETQTKSRDPKPAKLSKRNMLRKRSHVEPLNSDHQTKSQARSQYVYDEENPKAEVQVEEHRERHDAESVGEQLNGVARPKEQGSSEDEKPDRSKPKARQQIKYAIMELYKGVPCYYKTTATFFVGLYNSHATCFEVAVWGL
jgi:hypothetical protein